MNPTPFTTLAQGDYVNSNGNPVAASTVQALAPYRYIADGFYEWECGACKAKHTSRSCGWPIAGQVLICEDRGMDHPTAGDGCGAHNLLVKTNVKELDECFGMKLTLEQETATLRREQTQLQETIRHQTEQRLGNLLSLLEAPIAAAKRAAKETAP